PRDGGDRSPRLAHRAGHRARCPRGGERLGGLWHRAAGRQRSAGERAPEHHPRRPGRRRVVREDRPPGNPAGHSADIPARRPRRPRERAQHVRPHLRHDAWRSAVPHGDDGPRDVSPHGAEGQCRPGRGGHGDPVHDQPGPRRGVRHHLAARDPKMELVRLSGLQRLARAAAVGLALAFAVLPLLWVVSIAVRPGTQAVYPISILPTSLTLDNITGVLFASNGIWLMAGTFRQIPVRLEQAARIDGAGTVLTMRRVVLPLAIPGILVVATLAFIDGWNSFSLPLILIPKAAAQPYTVALQRYIQEI